MNRIIVVQVAAVAAASQLRSIQPEHSDQQNDVQPEVVSSASVHDSVLTEAEQFNLDEKEIPPMDKLVRQCGECEMDDNLQITCNRCHQDSDGDGQ